MSVLNILKSDGFMQVTHAIKLGFLNLAEAELMAIEADHSAHEHEYTHEENALIDQAIEICWRKIEERSSK